MAILSLAGILRGRLHLLPLGLSASRKRLLGTLPPFPRTPTLFHCNSLPTITHHLLGIQVSSFQVQPIFFSLVSANLLLFSIILFFSFSFSFSLSFSFPFPVFFSWKIDVWVWCGEVLVSA